jgi:hypothetical protein
VISTLWNSNGPRFDAKYDHPHLDCTLPHPRITSPTRDAAGPPPLNDDIMHTWVAWTAVCDMTNLLLDEWDRKQKGVPSCLDPNNYACDWQPQDFVDRFVTENVNFASAAKEYEYKNCKRWTAGGQVTSTNSEIGVPLSSRGTLKAFRDFLTQRQVTFENLFQTVPVKLTDDFGTVRADSQSIGDNTFGASLGYSLGWHAHVLQREPDGPQSQQRICRLEGNTNATFNANATLFGEPVPLIDALAVLSVNEGGTGNPNLGTGKAWGNAHLYIVGEEIFDTHGQVDLTGGYDTGWGDSAQPQFVEAPFQAGPVTVTVSAGISYDYGVKVNLSAHPPLPTDPCDAEKAVFATQGTVSPYADLGVWVSVDASLAGIVGVGLEVNLTLVGLKLPLTVNLDLGFDKANNAAITFNATLDLDLHTLDGEIDFYIEALWMKVATFTLVKWNGFHHDFPIFRTPTVTLPLFQLPIPVSPPEGNSGSETN